MNNDNLAAVIRNKVDIVDIIGERIPLVKKGKNYFCICPFHDDTNPSMSVSREKQIYTCFTCKASGNVYNFLMDYDKMTFKEALHYLGDRVGVDTKSVKIEKTNSKYDKDYDAYDLTKKYYQNNLWTKMGEDALKYLELRGLGTDTIKEFEIGYSLKEYDDLTKLLTNKKYDLVLLNNLGLVNDSHDIYNDRIMFPLYDPSGRVVAFSGRIYKDTKNNKYINTKETEIFKKGDCLYHYHIAREEARIKKSIIIMEGFMDVIRSSTIGVKNTIALMGTALTSNQIKLIKRLSNNIILCLDGDPPGKKAAESIGEALLKEGIEVKVVTLPNNEDPDSFILKEGKDSFLSYLKNAVKYNDYKINMMKNDLDINSVESISNYINNVLKEISNIDDEIRVEIILKKLAKEYNIGYNTLRKRFLNFKEKKEVKVVPNKIYRKPKTKKDKYRKAIEQVIYFMLTNEWVVTDVYKEHLVIPDEDMRIMVKEIIYYYEKYGNINIADFMTYLKDKEDLLSKLSDILSEDYISEVNKDSLYLYFKVIRENAINKQIEVLEKKLKEELDEVKQAEIANKIAKLRIGDNING